MRRSPTAEIDARALVVARADGRCETWCGRPGTDWAHRVARAQGGPWCPSNGLLLCRWCHDWCHRHPEHAVAAGLTLTSSTDDPSAAPVWLPARRFAARTWQWRLLDGMGGKIAVPSVPLRPAPAQYPPDEHGPRGWLLDPQGH